MRCDESEQQMSMKRYHVIKSILGGSDVYDEDGKQVGYSLPGVFGDGEDFYDMEGNPVGQSFDTEYGADFVGMEANGFLDREILMGRNAWLDGDPFQRENGPEAWDAGSGEDCGPDTGWDE